MAPIVKIMFKKSIVDATNRMRRTGHDVEHITVVDRRRNFWLIFGFEGLQNTHRGTMDIARKK